MAQIQSNQDQTELNYGRTKSIKENLVRCY